MCERVRATPSEENLKTIIRPVSLFLVVLAAAVAAVSYAPAATVPGFKVLHSFMGVDGGSPNSLIQRPTASFTVPRRTAATLPVVPPMAAEFCSRTIPQVTSPCFTFSTRPTATYQPVW